MTRRSALVSAVRGLIPALALAPAAQAPPRSAPLLQLPRSVPGGPAHGATIEETLALREVTALALSPDGRRVAFALRQARPERNAYASALFVVPIGVVPAERTAGAAAPAAAPAAVPAATKLADVPEVAALQWTADSRFVTYITAAPHEARQVWRLPAAGGGVPQRMSASTTGVGTGLAAERVTYFPPYALSPDGRSLAYFTWDTAGAVRTAQARWAAPFVFDDAQVERTLDVLRPPSWRTVPLAAELWLQDLRSGRAEQVWRSPGTMQVDADPAGTIPPELAWSPDSRTLALVYYPAPRPGQYFLRHLGLYTVAERTFRPLLSDLGWTLFPRWLPDGRGLVVRSEGRLRPDQPRRFAYYEYRFADSSFREVAAPTDLAAQAGRALEAQLHGRATHCTGSAPARHVACLFETPTRPPEIAVAELPEGASEGASEGAREGVQIATPRLVTALNPEWRAVRLGAVSQLTWPWPGGTNDQLSATLVKPVDYVPGTRYPLLVMLYNQGAKNRFVAQAWSNWPVQAFAAKGYAVLLVNFPPTGFKPGDFAGAKWEEADGPVASIDSALHQVTALGLVDTTRMGILGWSWGSYVTSYLIGHYPDRFQAAASSEGQLYNLSSYWIATGDVRASLAAHTGGGGPYPRWLDQWQALSATTNAEHVKIPVLQEYRTSNPNGFEFNVAVTSQGGSAELVFYPDEVHVFEGPRNRLHSMQLNYDWFNFWLLGEEDPSPAKQAQYQRWRALRARQQQRATGDSGATPHGADSARSAAR